MAGKLQEKAKSKKQQQFMGVVRGLQKGTVNPDDASFKAKIAAKTMKKSDVEDFAKTKHKGLPEKIVIENNSGYRPISEIAREIRKDWKNVNYAAKPYLDAMMDLESIDDMYMSDSASGIISRFIGNASSWRGETAKRIKAELNAMLKGKPVPVVKSLVPINEHTRIGEEDKDEAYEDSVKIAIEKFEQEYGKTFGLRAFPGDVFRISKRSSFNSPKSGMQFVVEVKNDEKGEWQDFGRDNEKLVRREVVKQSIAEIKLRKYIRGKIMESISQSMGINYSDLKKIVKEEIESYQEDKKSSTDELYIEYMRDMKGEDPFKMGDGKKYQYVWAKYPDGHEDIGVYEFSSDMTIGYDVFKRWYNIDKNSSKIKESFHGTCQTCNTSECTCPGAEVPAVPLSQAINWQDYKTTGPKHELILGQDQNNKVVSLLNYVKTQEPKIDVYNDVEIELNKILPGSQSKYQVYVKDPVAEVVKNIQFGK